jgi:hypothetical protein
MRRFVDTFVVITTRLAVLAIAASGWDGLKWN